MDPLSSKIYKSNEQIIQKQAAAYFGVKETALKRLGSFESVVFDCQNGSDNFIMKITHDLHRSAEAIYGELDWVEHLHKNNVSIASPIYSTEKKLVEEIKIEGSSFFVYAFEKIDGKHISMGNCTDELLIKWGEVTGRMHNATKSYKPTKAEWSRHHWSDEISKYVDEYLPGDQVKVLQQCQNIQKQLASLPINEDSYGLIHSDLHHGNFFINNSDEMVVFDTDDSHYEWFIYDITIPLFYSLADKNIGYDNIEFVKRYMKYFMEGYNRENILDKSWLEHIPLFLKLREIELYIILYSEGDLEPNDWCRRLMDGRREKIENNVQFIDMDFTTFK